MGPPGKKNLLHSPSGMLINALSQRDDWLWDRLQPLLRHVSRLWDYLIEHDPYWKALLDPFNRVRVSESRDPRHPKMKTMCPLSSFGSRLDEHVTGRHRLAEKLSAHIDGAAKTLQFLEDSLQFEVTSANHFEGDDPGPDATYAAVHLGADLNPASKVIFKTVVHVAVDSMYPLLHDGYQASEQMMAIHSLSLSILHELASRLSPLPSGPCCPADPESNSTPSILHIMHGFGTQDLTSRCHRGTTDES